MVATGTQVHIEDTGSGNPVLFVPGSYSTSAAWRGVQKHLDGRYRLIGTSLNGYGRTGETRSAGDCDIAHGVRLIEALAARIGQPFHLVGHSFGGYLALAAALAGTIKPLSLSLFEANPIPVLKGPRPDLFTAAEQMTAGFADALARGDADAAALIIDFWGGSGSFAAMPATVQDYCRAGAATNLLDWRGAMSASIEASDCARIDCDVLLVRGGKANDLIVAITDLLAAHLPRARTAVVEEAGHFLISSHPSQCAALLGAFLRRD